MIGSSERTEPIAPDQSARRNGNSHRTLIAPAIGATAIADCLLPANWPRNCEYGPIFDPLRPDLRERLRSATPRFLAGPRMQFHCMRYWMRKQTPLIAFAAFMLSAGIAHAQFLFWPQYTFWRGHYAPFKHKHHHRQTNSESAKNARPEDPPKGPLQIIISIADQRVSLFDNGALIARSSVSTGTQGHPTPLGVFSVISKQRWHRSNIYSAAPMPYMQRITWSGTSHGCIRLKDDFAIRLWHLTKRGTRVIIAHDDVQPVEITNPHLFKPKAVSGSPEFQAVTVAGKSTLVSDAESSEATSLE